MLPPTLFDRLKRFVHTRLLHTPSKLAREVKKESEEFNQKLIEQHLRESASHTKTSGPVTTPDRFVTTTYEDLHTYYLRAKNHSERDTLPDSVWGLLAEATTVFAHDEQALREEDFEALSALAEEGEEVHILTLKTLFERKKARDAVADHIRLQTLKIQGKRE